MPDRFKFSKRCFVGLLLLIAGVGLAVVFSPRSASGGEANDETIARGGGTTIVHGGTGPTGGFLPVLTTIAFHAERTGGGVTGSFECLARAPEARALSSPSTRCTSLDRLAERLSVAILRL